MKSESSTQTIGLIVSNAKNSFTTALMNLFNKELTKRDYYLVIGFTNHSIEKERFYLEKFGKTTDGIFIFSDSSDYQELADVVPTNVPTVFLHRAPSHCERTAILENDYSATFQAILAMIHSNHPKIALVCRSKAFSSNREVIRAYHAAMDTTSDGFCEDHIFECTSTDAEYLDRLIKEITDAGCTAILASSVEVTERLAPYLYTYNRSHNTSLVLTGFSTEGYHELLSSSLNTVERPVKRMVDLAIQQMFYQMGQENLIHTALHVKGSLQTWEHDSLSD